MNLSKLISDKIVIGTTNSEASITERNCIIYHKSIMCEIEKNILFDKENNVIEINSKNQKKIFKYDAKGHIINKQFYKPLNILYSETDYIYNGDYLVQQIEYKKSKASYSFTIEWDTINSKTTSSFTTFPEGLTRSTKYQYDNNNNITSLLFFDFDNVLDRKFTYLYNNNKLIEKEYINFYKKSTKKTVYKYDSLNRLIEENIISNKKQISYNTFKYDTKGNIISTKKRIFDMTKYLKYDSYGNWVVKAYFDNKGKEVYKIIREISYY